MFESRLCKGVIETFTPGCNSDWLELILDTSGSEGIGSSRKKSLFYTMSLSITNG